MVDRMIRGRLTVAALLVAGFLVAGVEAQEGYNLPAEADSIEPAEAVSTVELAEPYDEDVGELEQVGTYLPKQQPTQRYHHASTVEFHKQSLSSMTVGVLAQTWR